MFLRLYNTLTRRVEEFRPGNPGRITFYSCGPTVYDDAHIGNFRAFLTADLLRRFLESPLCALANETAEQRQAREQHGRTVVHVMNITDVGHMTDDQAADGAGEDKMEAARRRLMEAKKAGTLPPDAAGLPDPSDPFAIAEFYTRRFLEDARRLGLRVAIEAATDPTLMPRATTSIRTMIRIIERLMARGHAYAVGPPGAQTVYFAVESLPSYGKLSGNTLDRLRHGAGGRVLDVHQAQKRHPADFLLWKSDRAHLMKWPSPWGEGYPGWHIECSAMSYQRLVADDAEGPLPLVPDGDALIDIHSGGEDNIFPHHECEIAQTCAAFNETPDQGVLARLWFHTRFLLVEGQKMSKSLGNFYTARDLFERGFEPGAVRLELIGTHYRANADFSLPRLRDASRTLERWRRFAARAHHSAEAGTLNTAVREAFVGALHDDLNVAQALAEVNRWIARTPTPTRADAALFDQFDAVLGVLACRTPAAAETAQAVFAPGVVPGADLLALLEERRQARRARDYARADAIRARLADMGYEIKDLADERVEVRRRGT